MDLKRNRYTVVVGNIGTVYDGGNRRVALETFKVYKSRSIQGSGRAAGESVYLMGEGEPVKEFIGVHAHGE
jgi:hypothetical protein